MNARIFITVLMFTGVLSTYSNTQIMMMIEEPLKKKGKRNSKRPRDHTLLRNEYKLKLMSDEQKRLFNIELSLKKKKLEQGDMRIKELKKILEKVKVYRTSKEIKKRKKKEKLFVVKYEPDLAAEVARRVSKDGEKIRKGKSLASLMKEKRNIGNPFEEMVAVQDVIEKAQEPVSEREKKEKKEIKEMLKRKGMKEMIKIQGRKK